MFAEFEYPVSQNMFGTVWVFVIVDNSLRKNGTLSCWTCDYSKRDYELRVVFRRNYGTFKVNHQQKPTKRL
jgi:hypothetical protein